MTPEPERVPDRAPDRYAVIGHPVAHSRSPWIHAQFARQTGQSLVYSAIDAAPGKLPATLREFFAHGGRGLNVTVPHKQAVLAYLDRLSERARTAGAVNTIVREADDSLLGDNTDGIGFVRDLTRNLRVSVAGQRVLILGAGGATRGLLAPLLALAPGELVIANRSPERASELAALFSAQGTIQGAGFAELGARDARPFALIINATAAGLQNELPPLPESVLRAASVCYDLGYAHGTTRFVQWARDCGVARCFTGAGMLVEQAADSFLLWRGMRPDTTAVLAALGDS
jgi:shikimate dehydrogenase